MKAQKQFRPALLVVLAASLTWGLVSVASAAEQGSFQRKLQVSGPVTLDVVTGSGDIQIRNGVAGEVQVMGRIRVSTDWFGGGSDARDKVKRLEANPPIQQSGNIVRVGHITDPSLRRNISISYELVVPADTRLQSQTGSGDQTISGIQGPVEVQAGSGNVTTSAIGGPVQAQTGSGNLTLHDVRGNVRARAGSGEIEATAIGGGFDGESGSGNVTLTQSAPGSVRVHSGSGDMELRGVHGSLEAETGSGQLHAEGRPSGAWRLRSGSGDIHLKLATEAGFDLDAKTGSGDISLGSPITVQGNISRKSVQGKVRGGGVPVAVETGSGGIEIE
ncbi:MAG: DUF4097 family beta strand repeat protein [Acidobacteria bacterium]|nr:DUF4097 family beta strand repeat protein [Acidobacteriota bacterium]